MKVLIITMFLCLATFSVQANATDVTDLKFLSGCWKGTLSNGLDITENLSSPDGGIILGHAKTLQEDRLVEYEQIEIVSTGRNIYYSIIINGEYLARFKMTKLDTNQSYVK